VNRETERETKEKMKESAGTLQKCYACVRMKTAALLSTGYKLCSYAFNVQGTTNSIRYC
jgi:hypothetical protein